jgi:acetyltransferase
MTDAVNVWSADRLARLDRMFRPRTIAVVGASPNNSFISGTLSNILRHGFEGRAYAVNPRYTEVHGAPCFPTVEEVPEAVDLVFIGVGARLVPGILEQCERKGVGSLCIVTSGYSEQIGDEGQARQSELAAWAQRTGIPVGGPNCLGFMNMPHKLCGMFLNLERLIPGHIGLVLQSGQMGSTITTPLLARGVGFSTVVTAGNEVDLETADYIRYFVDDEQTRVIATFTEQFKTPSKLMAACELAAERGKPIVMLKIGRSEGGQRAARAHTGSIVGSDGAVGALLRKLGVARVHSVDELIETAAIFHSRKLPKRSGVASIFVSGGACGLASDLAQDIGVTFPPLTEETSARLRTIVPEFGNVGNPLDVTGQGVFEPDIFRQSLELLAETPGVGVVINGTGFPTLADRSLHRMQSLEACSEKHPDVVFLQMALVGGHFHAMAMPGTVIKEPTDRIAGVPFLQSTDNSLRAVKALVEYAEFQRRRGQARPTRRSDRGAGEIARRTITDIARTLTEREAKMLLAAYGIPVTAERPATTALEAADAAEAIGYPVALKVESPDILHKTEAGGVLLGLTTAEAVRTGFDSIVESVAMSSPTADVHGVLVQQMATEGVQMILGMTRDPKFGPVVAVGLGGIFVEVLNDVQLLIPPFGDDEAADALTRLRGSAVLDGVRGRPAADRAALIDAMVRFGELCSDVGDIVDEIDVNPFIVGPVGSGGVAVDCLIVPVPQISNSKTRGD